VTRFLASLGDRINPIVVKETRQAVNSRLVAGFLLLFLGIEVAVVTLMIAGRGMQDPNQLDLRAGREIFTIVQGILLGTCMILIPTMTAVRLASERSDVNVDLLFISSLSPRSVLGGKLFAAAALALLIFSAAAPFMTFAYVMRGLDVPTIFVVLLADFLAVLVATSFLLLIASIPAPRGLRIVLGLIGFILICYMGAGLLALSSEFLRYGVGYDTSSRAFWLGLSGMAAVVFGMVGLFMMWAVALVSPQAANRAFGVRVYTVSLWLLEGIICAIWSWWVGEPEPIQAWGFVGAIWFSFQMLVAICERDTWGPRVARKIPRNPLLWLPAFLTYSGAAGGLLFAVLGCLISLAGIALAGDLFPSRRGRAGVETEMLEVAGLIAGYTYCYSLTAVILRRAFAHTAFRPGYTWLVAGILFGLGCTIPFILRFAFISDRNHGYDSDTLWLYLPNPVVTIDQSVSERMHRDSSMAFGFIGLWGAAATLANLPWLARQVVTFRRRETAA
jgi:hypothetical protein